MLYRIQNTFSVLIFLFLCLLNYPLLAQKVSVNRGIVSIDGVPALNVERNTKNENTYVFSNLDQQTQVIIEEVILKSYMDGPQLSYWKVYNAAKDDSCLVDHKICTTSKKAAVFIVINGLIQDGKFVPSVFSKLKKKFDQQMGVNFLKENELSFDNLVPRKVDQPLEIVYAVGDDLLKNKKYKLGVGVSPNIKVIGYAYLKEKKAENSESGVYLQWDFYLPNHLLVATTVSATANSDYFASIKTLADEKNHSIRANVKRNHLLEIAALLVELGYM